MTRNAITWKQRCSAVSSRTGEPCKRWAITGGTVCPVHGGTAPTVRARAQERALEVRLNGELVRRGWEPVTDPVAWYQDIAGEVRTFLEVCREAVGDLHEIGYRDRIGTENVRAALLLYERALDRAQRTADAMLARGIEAKAARLADQGATALIADLTTLIEWARASDDSPEELILRLIDNTVDPNPRSGR